MEKPKTLTPEEMAKIEEHKILSDAELIEGGAKIEVDKDGNRTNLLITEKQYCAEKFKGSFKYSKIFEVPARGRLEVSEDAKEKIRSNISALIKQLEDTIRLESDESLEWIVDYIGITEDDKKYVDRELSDKTSHELSERSIYQRGLEPNPEYEKIKTQILEDLKEENKYRYQPRANVRVELMRSGEETGKYLSNIEFWAEFSMTKSGGVISNEAIVEEIIKRFGNHK